MRQRDDPVPLAVLELQQYAIEFAEAKEMEEQDKKEREVEGENLAKMNADKKKKKSIVGLIQRHYTVKAPIKDKSQLRREKWILPGLRFNRWSLMPAALLTQFCCGSLYSWSVFNKPIDNLIYGPDSSEKGINMAPTTFYIAVGCFGVSAAIMGPWLERVGPKRSLALAASLLYAGNLISALGLHLKLIWLIYFGYGVIAGFGIGLGYISPVSSLQKWFPDHRGLASGFSVCGFGAGSIVISKIQLPLIGLVGLPLTFIILGSIYFVCMILCTLIIRTPPPGFSMDGTSTTTVNTNAKNSSNTNGSPAPVVSEPDHSNTSSQLTLIQSLTSTTYRLMYFMFLSHQLFGLLIMSRLSNMITDIFSKSSSEASTIVAINGGFNLIGRLAVPIASDFVGRKNVYVVMLSIQLIILGTFTLITTHHVYWGFLLSMWTLTFCYGGAPGAIPAFLTDQFGSSNTGAAHGIILTAWSTAGVVGGLVFTAIFDHIVQSSGGGSGGGGGAELNAVYDPWPYNANVYWILGIVLLGWTTTLFIQPTPNDVKFRNKISYALKCKCMRNGAGSKNENPENPEDKRNNVES